MAKSFENESRQDDFSILVAKEVQRILALYNEIMRERSSISPFVDTVNIPVVDLYSEKRQQAMHDDLAALASEFVRSLATQAEQRFYLNASEEAPVSVRTESAPGCAAPKTQDLQADCTRIEDWAGQIAGPTYLEEKFGIPRSTLHWWQRHNDVVALRKGARKHVFPLAQFIDARPAPGIRQVLSFIDNPRLAWLWLTSPSAQLEGRIPIDLLRLDQVSEVVQAAQVFSLAL